MFPPARGHGGGVDVDGHVLDDETRGDALALASELRQAGLRVDVYPEASRQARQAVQVRVTPRRAVVAILGDDERARGEVSDQGPAHAREQTVLSRARRRRVIAALLN